MLKAQTQATITTKTLTKIYSKTPTKKKGPSKIQTVQCASKWKPDDNPTDSDKSSGSDQDSSHVPHKKCAKQSVDDGMETVDDEPEVVINLVSGSGGDDATSSSDKVWNLTYL